jgi:hypothetical protein
MKLVSVILIAVIGFSTPSFAAKEGKRAGKRGEVRKVLRLCDRNRNKQIDGTEIQALKNAYAALKRIDINSDGSFDDEEIKGLNAKAAEGKAKINEVKGKKKKRKKAE